MSKPNLKNKLAHILRRLDWRDLEQLVDLIFARSGWQRLTVLGVQEQDIDLITEEPVFGDRAWVQVKAQSSIATVKDYLRRFEADGSCQRFVFAFPELQGDLAGVPLSETDEIWDGAVLAGKAMNAGLTEWVFQRV